MAHGALAVVSSLCVSVCLRGEPPSWSALIARCVSLSPLSDSSLARSLQSALHPFSLCLFSPSPSLMHRIFGKAKPKEPTPTLDDASASVRQTGEAATQAQAQASEPHSIGQRLCHSPLTVLVRVPSFLPSGREAW